MLQTLPVRSVLLFHVSLSGWDYKATVSSFFYLICWSTTVKGVEWLPKPLCGGIHSNEKIRDPLPELLSSIFAQLFCKQLMPLCLLIIFLLLLSHPRLNLIVSLSMAETQPFFLNVTLQYKAINTIGKKIAYQMNKSFWKITINHLLIKPSQQCCTDCRHLSNYWMSFCRLSISSQQRWKKPISLLWLIHQRSFMPNKSRTFQAR